MNEEDFIELKPEEGEYTDNPCSDDTEELLKKYEKKRSQKIDDIFAMQTVVCVMAAAALLIANLIRPDIAVPVYERLQELVTESTEIMPNPIDFILSQI